MSIATVTMIKKYMGIPFVSNKKCQLYKKMKRGACTSPQNEYIKEKENNNGF